MLQKLIQTVGEGGYILVDDAYVNEGYSVDRMLTEKEWEQLFTELGLKQLGIRPGDIADIEEINRIYWDDVAVTKIVKILSL